MSQEKKNLRCRILWVPDKQIGIFKDILGKADNSEDKQREDNKND